jgi:hypothetical protein
MSTIPELLAVLKHMPVLEQRIFAGWALWRMKTDAEERYGMATRPIGEIWNALTREDQERAAARFEQYEAKLKEDWEQTQPHEVAADRGHPHPLQRQAAVPATGCSHGDIPSSGPAPASVDTGQYAT